MRSAFSVRSYSIIIFAFCLIFLIFGYRSLRSNKIEDLAGGYGHSKERISKLKICSDLSQIGRFNICSIQTLNKARNCLVFSVATQSDLKFEMEIAQRLDKCKVRVYDHEAKATNSEGRYRVIETIDTQFINENVLKKILDSEKGKIQMLRLEAGDKGAHLARSKMLKDRSVCHLLLTLYNINNSGMNTFLKAMDKEQGFKLYSMKELKAEKAEDNEQSDREEEEKDEDEEEEEEEETVTKMDNDGAKKGHSGQRTTARHYTLSLIGQHCQKNYGIKEK